MDASPLQGNPSALILLVLFYIPGWKEVLQVLSVLSKNTMQWLKPRLLDPESSTLTIGPLCLQVPKVTPGGVLAVNMMGRSDVLFWVEN